MTLPVDRLRRHHAATEREIEHLQARHDELHLDDQASVGNINDTWLDEQLAAVRQPRRRSTASKPKVRKNG